MSGVNKSILRSIYLLSDTFWWFHFQRLCVYGTCFARLPNRSAWVCDFHTLGGDFLNIGTVYIYIISQENVNWNRELSIRRLWWRHIISNILAISIKKTKNKEYVQAFPCATIHTFGMRRDSKSALVRFQFTLWNTACCSRPRK